VTASFDVAVLGLGEAGSALALDLVDAGCGVRGWDPARRAEPVRVPRARSAKDAVRGADLVLSVNAAAVALEVAEEVVPALTPSHVYGDLNTGPPALKSALEGVLLASGATFADVALLGPVTDGGIRTPALVAGSGAERFAELLAPLGMPIEVVGPEAGMAAARKLVRSVFMKGLAASAIESLEAGAAAGAEEWVRAEIVRALDTPGAPLLERLLAGTRTHARRRRDEMSAAAAYLLELGVEPRVARAAEAWLEAIARENASASLTSRP
jgi:3-hydroxyisobutyrate dehydrogenase-like beta-hydroxyacid dehydrogenase